MKKLLYLNQAMGMGGAEVFMADLLEALQKLHWQVEAVTTRAAFVQYLAGHSIQTKQVPFVMDLIGNWKGLLKAVVFGPLAFFQWLNILLQHRRRSRQTTILLSGFNEKLLVTGVAKALGFKVVWIQFSGLGSLLNIWGGWVGAWFKWSIRCVDRVITSSEHSKRAVVSELGVAAQQVVVIPCGRNLETRAFNDVSQKNILCISRLQPGKGQDLLIQAMPAILQKHPEARLSIIGEGDFETRLRALVSQLNLEQKVIFKGRVDSTAKVLEQAMICVFPSVWELEGFGLVLIEAMAAAKPVVTFDRGPMNEIIQHQQNGLLAKSGSVEDLADKSIALLEDRSLRKKLATQAVKDFEARYTVEQVANLYDKILADEKT